MRPFDVIVVSHGDLAEAMVASAFMICGKTDGVRTVGLQPTDSPETFSERLVAVLTDGHPTLILSDLYGGTPNNVVMAAARTHEMVRGVSGVNLGLVLEAMTADEDLDDELVDRLVTLAREGVLEVTSRVGPVN